MDFKLFLETTELDMPKVTFPRPGGKARMTKWLFQYFPKNGRIYVEPFAGAGNVFFAAKQELHFREWHLNDLQTGSFLKSIIEVNPKDLPYQVPKEDFPKWKDDNSHVSNVIQGAVTHKAKGYPAGWAGDCGTHVGYRGDRFGRRIEDAKTLLDQPNVEITSMSWEKMPYRTYGSQDFIYFDPPYYGADPKSVGYPQINHEDLLKELRRAKYRWILSGYDNDLYKQQIGDFWKASTTRNAEMASSNQKKAVPRVETIWSNF